MPIDITPQHLAIIKQILLENLPINAKVWVFGSRATEKAKKYSDLDLAIESATGEIIDFKIICKLKDDFENSNLPWMVDIVDLNNIEISFKKIIDEHKIYLSFN